MSDFTSAFPNSSKVYDEHQVTLTPDGASVTLRVPAR